MGRPVSGFTLLEILVVISILAAIAAIAAPAFDNIDKVAGDDMTRAEIARLAVAVRQFKHDTGYYPKQGPFSGNKLAEDFADAVVRAKHAEEIDHPANWSQLYEQPKNLATGDVVWAWDQDVARGWRGPYLTTFGEGKVDVGLGLASDGAGDPFLGNLIKVTSIADPYQKRPSGSHMVWNNETELVRGRPYLLLMGNGANVATGCTMPCIISLGRNGEYDLGSGDDIVLNIGGG